MTASADEAVPTSDRPSGVQSIDRAVAILTAFSRARPVLGISELARHTDLTRGTTHRLVSALAAHGMLAQVPGSTAYSLGPRLLGLAEAARDQLSLDVQAPPVMTWLRDRTGETVGLHILDALPSRRTIAQVESLQPLRRTYTDLGASRPPHQGAPGKLLLAHAPGRVAAEVVAALGRAEPAAAEELAAELDRVRAEGYAISLEERVRGVVALAVPVRDHKGEVAAALSVSVPAVRAGRPELVAMAPLAQEAAARLSSRLGHEPGDAGGVADGAD
ncbi:IclR family transcriptional regulator [Streptomyces hoynatensis]|uniref:IclR family transcriptional regulator n=1 Tax=Streptomyces hoynatensis TaxID=1141874 RepID=UPI00131A2CC4|nr:IclR family transcriptional regulator [Streptomyces hoynatensis]